MPLWSLGSPKHSKRTRWKRYNWLNQGFTLPSQVQAYVSCNARRGGAAVGQAGIATGSRVSRGAAGSTASAPHARLCLSWEVWVTTSPHKHRQQSAVLFPSLPSPKQPLACSCVFGHTPICNLSACSCPCCAEFCPQGTKPKTFPSRSSGGARKGRTPPLPCCCSGSPGLLAHWPSQNVLCSFTRHTCSCNSRSFHFWCGSLSFPVLSTYILHVEKKGLQAPCNCAAP